jgi:hypothetical protein
MKFNTKNGTLVQLSNFKAGKAAGRTRNRIILKTQQKNFSSLLEIKASKKWYKEKSDEVKSDFLRNILW